MNYKELIIKMINEMDNELYLLRAYHYILAKYKRWKGGAGE